MSAISGFINTIRNAVYGEQVRGAIISALEQCYSDVNAPSLQTAAFTAALNAAYAGGILDIQTVTQISAMTNQNIIYRYNGTQAGYQKGLYYYSPISSSWVLIGSEVHSVSLANQMTDTSAIYKYTGTQTGMVQNSLYCHNGTAWVPIGSGLLTASTAAQMTNQDAIYKYTGSEIGYVTNALYYYNGDEWAQIGASDADEEIEGIKSVLEFSHESAVELFDKTTIFDKNGTYTSGYFVSAADGSLRNNTNTGASDFIDVSAYKFIDFTRNVASAFQFAFYDSSQNYLMGKNDDYSSVGVKCYEVPAGAKYVRLSFYLSSRETFVAKGYTLKQDTGILIDGFSVKNTSTASVTNSPWKLPTASYGYTYGVTIAAVLLDAKSTGAFTIGVATDTSGGVNVSDFILSDTIQIEATGAQIVPLNNPIQISQGQVLAVSVPSDTATFQYGAYGEEKGFMSRTGQSYDNSLGVTVIYYDGEIEAEYTSERLDRIESQLSTINESVYKGKTLSILGDSISTFAGYIPQGNANFYTGSNCGVSSVNDTWWMKLKNALGMTIGLNQSWSGSRVTTTNGTESAGCMARCQNLGTNPDVIIVYMGINDFNNEVALGTYDGNGDFPTATTTFREAYAIMLDKIMTAYPHAEIWCATLPSCEKNGSIGAPEKNGNGVLLNDFNEAIRQLAKVFGAKVLEHALCGITYQNMNIYMGDFDSSSNALHPNALGHTLIANNDIRHIDSGCRTRY